MTGFRLVEQIGDLTFDVPGPAYATLPDALIALVDLAVGCDEEREFFVDGPGLDHPIGVGRQDEQAH